LLEPKLLEPRVREAQGNNDQQMALTQEYEQGVRRCITDAEPLLPDVEKRINAIIKVNL